MGFGSGYNSRTVRGGKSYNNSMCAHVWNAGEEERGQSSNGNLFFNGPALYSYGSHFVVAYRMPDGTVFHNADSYSVSTSGHQSDAKHAASDRQSAGVTGLTGMVDALDRIADYVNGCGLDRSGIQSVTRAALLAHAVALSVQVYPAGKSRYSDGYYSDADGKYVYPDTNYQEAGAYLARLVGLPAASWDKIKRDAATKEAKRLADQASAAKSAAESRALRLADMSDKAWREYVVRVGTDYNNGFPSIGKELKRARSLALHAKRGPLASKKRLATLRARVVQIAAEVTSFDTKRGARIARNTLAVSLATVRNWRDASESARLSPSWSALQSLGRAAQYVAERGRLPALKASAAELSRMADIGKDLVEAESARLRLIERQNEAKAREERIALWLAGEPVGYMRFDAASGGAALRVRGDTLETSHGAEVPLAHAVKVFRFVKLCRERAFDPESHSVTQVWHRNGKTIRVGHFQVDYVYSDGSFVAGCHTFTWPEVERVAIAAGVFDCEASDAAIELTSVAA